MNYVKGKLIEAEERAEALVALPAYIANTLAGKPLTGSEVISACDQLSKTLGEAHISLLEATAVPPHKAEEYVLEAKTQLSADYLNHKLEIELGGTYGRQRVVQAEAQPITTVVEEVAPLGVLFHIVAGNVSALPAFSVVEGLLVGNINLMKLPSNDNDLSLFIINELVSIEPRLADYIYVFDYSSQDIEELRLLANLADAIVVWGGDEAVSAARSMAPPNTRVIEWGHKISFAYGVPGPELDNALDALAASMLENNQLFCSSCQGLYVDTDDIEVVHEYAQRMLDALEACVSRDSQDIGLSAQLGLKLHSQLLESIYQSQTVYRGEKSSVIASEDKRLETSLQFGNCWVKPLPRQGIIPVIRPHKNHLQTCALICPDSDYELLKQLLQRAGIVRVCGADAMEKTYLGMPHDGEYALRRYTRVVSG